MAVALEIGVGNLPPEFLANALVFGYPLAAARAVASAFFQAPAYHFHDLLVVVFFYHNSPPKEKSGT